MSVNFNFEDYDSALRQLNRASPSSTKSPASSEPLATSDWMQNEKFRVRVITARTKLKLMRDRSDALRDSLQRFRDRQGCANGI